MKIVDLNFSEYYHNYMVFEADALTDGLKDQIDITIDDCFALCSSYVNEAGVLNFQVLAVGDAWNHCLKGLRRNAMLGVFSVDDIFDCELQFIEPTMRMKEKNERWLEEKENMIDEDIRMLRYDTRLDGVRGLYHPDIVKVGILKGQYLYEYYMQIKGMKGPFIEGNFVFVPSHSKDVKENEAVRALPIFVNEGYHLVAVFIGDHISAEEEKRMEEILQEGIEDEFGITVKTLKN